MMPILANIDWNQIGETVIQQQRNREIHAPIVSMYRWWARRPHSLIGAILDAAIKVRGKRHLRVSDPFSGGGTVAFEAVRRGLPVYAQDIYPWPTMGLGVALAMTSVKEFSGAASDLLNYLEPLRSAYRRPDGRELSHVLRVRRGVCPQCIHPVYLFFDPLISLASRGKNETRALFGCRACGNVHVGHRHKATYKCGICGQRNRQFKEAKGFFTCPHCGRDARLREFIGAEPAWKPIAVQELTAEARRRAFLRLVEPGDPVDSYPASKSLTQMRMPILDGVETRRLHDSGFRAWGDLYTIRQAEILFSALNFIENMNVSNACKDRLAIAVIGAAEMPAFLSRWDRYHLKNFEGLANHRYADTTIVTETNLLSSVGRGTLPHRFDSGLKALKWVLKEVTTVLEVKRSPRIARRVELKKGIMIATGNSARQSLKDGTIDIVLTDPPYFGDVQYGELSRLFHFWLSLYKKLPNFDEREESVPNRVRGNGSDFYVRSIASCLEESKRTLAPGGRLILTFHNKKMPAWLALCASLIRAGFIVRAVAVTHAENDADHGKRNGKGMLHDLVLECVRREDWSNNRAQTFTGHVSSNRELQAMGLALTRAIRLGNPDALPIMFKVELKRLGIKESCIH